MSEPTSETITCPGCGHQQAFTISSNISPAFFVDAYRANGFEPVKVFRRRAKDRRATQWDYKPQVTQVLGGGPGPRGRRYLMHVVAGKAREARGFRVPHQARYVEGHWRS